ncbi:MAG: TolA-binding protein, partial [Saprospiraceae bacterium]
ACETYAAANATDPKSPEILLKAAETARNVEQHDRAIAIYDLVLSTFSSYPKAPQALFLKAFTLDDNMGNKEGAKVLYEEFIEKYPNNDFAESAKFMLENLYKTDAEIIQEFENKRKEGEQ